MIPTNEILSWEGITDEDKKDLVHWMTYREKRPPSPSPESVLEKMKQQPADSGKDRFLECEFIWKFETISLEIILVEDEVMERKQFIEEMSKVILTNQNKL